VPPVSGQVTWGQWENTAAGGHIRSGTGAGGVQYVEEIRKDDGFYRTTTYTQGAQQGQKKEEHWASGLYSVKVWNGKDWLIMEGQENAQNHQWTVRKWDGNGVLQRTEVYEKIGGRLLQADGLANDGKTTYHGQLTDKGQWLETWDNSPSLAGSVQTRTNLYATYGGKLVYRTFLYRDGHFTEEAWEASGRYVKNVWTKRDHGDANSKEHISETIWEGNKATVTLYHQAGYYEVSQNGWGIGPSTDARVTYVYSVDANGKVQEWLEYHVQEMDPSWKGWGISWVKHCNFNDPGYESYYDASGYSQPDGSKWGGVNSLTMMKFGMAPTQLNYGSWNNTWLSRDAK
jgi:hypothetical protein